MGHGDEKNYAHRVFLKVLIFWAKELKLKMLL